MSLAPEKRRRRPVVYSENDGDPRKIIEQMDEHGFTKRSGDSTQVRSSFSTRKRQRTSKALPSRSRSKVTNLHTFFNSRTQSQSDIPQLRRLRQTGSSQTQQKDQLDLKDDGIEELEDSSEHSQGSFETRAPVSFEAQRATESQTLRDQGILDKITPDDELSQSRQVSASTGPWPDAFPPVSLAELAVNKKKITETSNWINEAMTGPYGRRLLVLRGPAGSGKTSTVEILAKTKGIRLVEWCNPSQAVFGDDSFVSISVQFSDFLNRGNKFVTLDLAGQSTSHSAVKSVLERDILLVEELPVSLLKNHATLSSLRSAILMHLEGQDASPVILVFSEDESTQGDPDDSWTSRRILGPDILTHASTVTIEFNRIAPTFMKKALDLVLQKESRLSGRSRLPSKDFLHSIVTSGDIRCAVGMLQMHCMNNSDTRRRAPALVTSLRGSSSENLTLKESPLSLFHAIGKIVYNKREQPQKIQPPTHMTEHYRPLASCVDTEALLSRFGVDMDVFIAALQENYLVPCTSDDNLLHVEAAAEHMSFGDSLWAYGTTGSEKRLSWFSPLLKALEDIRHAEIICHATILGLIFSLPPSGPKTSYHKGSSQKLTYPTLIKARRQEADAQLDLDKRIRDIYCHSAGSRYCVGVSACNYSGYVSQTFAETPTISHSFGHDEGLYLRMSRDDIVLLQSPYEEMIYQGQNQSAHRRPLTDLGPRMNKHSKDGSSLLLFNNLDADRSSAHISALKELVIADDEIEDDE